MHRDSSKPRFAVAHLSVGEVTADESLLALRAQVNVDLETKEIVGLRQQQAHQQCYLFFNRSRANVEAFVKCDADMVLLNTKTFAAADKVFRNHASVDMLSIPLLDDITGRIIYGMHIWRSTVIWRTWFIPKLHTDSVPNTVRAYLPIIATNVGTLGLHRSAASTKQLIDFWVRRLVKAGKGGAFSAAGVSVMQAAQGAQERGNSQQLQLILATCGAVASDLRLARRSLSHVNARQDLHALIASTATSIDPSDVDVRDVVETLVPQSRPRITHRILWHALEAAVRGQRRAVNLMDTKVGTAAQRTFEHSLFVSP